MLKGMPTPQMLIITTNKDVSLPLFGLAESQQLIEPVIISYAAPLSPDTTVLQATYPFVYFRDPFNDPAVSQGTVQQIVQTIFERYPLARYVDHLTSYQDLLLEDKWKQYQLFSDFMPPTRVLQANERIDFTTEIVKGRISSRARDIILTEEVFSAITRPNNYIVQQRLAIEAEYRVYMVGEVICTPLALKTSKREHQKVKIADITEHVDHELRTLCLSVHARTGYDLMGLDVAKTADGYRLIEVNRSCQCSAFYKKSGQNVIAALCTVLAQEISR